VGEVLVKAQLYHLQINVRDASRSLPFYKALLGYLDYQTVYETDSMAGFSGPGTDIWVGAAAPARSTAPRASFRSTGRATTRCSSRIRTG
jgi:hypothetical protein